MNTEEEKKEETNTVPEDNRIELPKFGNGLKNPANIHKGGPPRGKRGMTLDKQQRVVKFLNEYTRNGGKITEAAMKVFKIDDRMKAQKLGSTYLKDARNLPELTRIILEEKGYGFGNFLDVAIEKMKASKGTEWWDRLLKMTEYADFISKPKEGNPAVNVTVFQTHKALSSEYVEDAEVLEEKKPDEN